MTALAVTTLGKVAYILFFLVLAGFLAAYGWLAPPSSRKTTRGGYLVLAAVILVFGAFGVAGGFHL